MKPTGCIRCGAAGEYVLHPLELVACGECFAAWIREPTCMQSEVEKAVGKFGAKPGSYIEYEKQFDAELLRRTTEWARKGRTHV